MSIHLKPEIIHSIIHPFVAEAYIKEEYRPNHVPRRILVIQSPANRNAADYQSFLQEFDLIADDLRRKGRSFDRVDIKMH